MSAIVGLAQTMASAIQTHISLGRQRKVYAQQARQAEAEAAAEQAEIRRKARYIQGASTARAGAAGGVDSPSALDVLVANAQEIGTDLAKARYQGAMQAWGFREAEAEAKWAQKFNMLTGGLAGAGYAAQIGKDVQGYRLSGDKDTWFTNFSSSPGGMGAGAFGSGYTGSAPSGLSEPAGYPKIGETVSGSWTDF